MEKQQSLFNFPVVVQGDLNEELEMLKFFGFKLTSDFLDLPLRAKQKKLDMLFINVCRLRTKFKK